MTPAKPLTHYQQQARLATWERMREALKKLVEVSEKYPFHLLSYSETKAKEILKETEEL